MKLTKSLISSRNTAIDNIKSILYCPKDDFGTVFLSKIKEISRNITKIAKKILTFRADCDTITRYLIKA